MAATCMHDLKAKLARKEIREKTHPDYRSIKCVMNGTLSQMEDSLFFVLRRTQDLKFILRKAVKSFDKLLA